LNSPANSPASPVYSLRLPGLFTKLLDQLAALGETAAEVKKAIRSAELKNTLSATQTNIYRYKIIRTRIPLGQLDVTVPFIIENGG
jgi:hypothetical protein